MEKQNVPMIAKVGLILLLAYAGFLIALKVRRGDDLLAPFKRNSAAPVEAKRQDRR
jgi:hypothetical protein